MSTVINSANFSAAMEKIKGLSTKMPAMPATAQPEPSFAPLTLEQVNAEIGKYRLSLEGDGLPDPIRKEVERCLAELVKQQFILVHGFVPDADGNPPIVVDEKAIVAKVIEEISAAPESSELEPGPEDEEEETEEDEEFDLDEQAEALNEIDEADAEVVSPAVPGVPWATDGIFLPAEVVSALRASMVANLPHITAHILTLVLGK